MKSTIITLVIFLACFIYLANTEFSLKPFKIQFNNWLLAVGWFVLLTGVLIIKYDAERKATEKTITEIQKVIDKVVKEKESNTCEADSL